MMAGDSWAFLRGFTQARIGLGRAGSTMPIGEVLKFAMAHARARDAVMTPINWGHIETNLQALELDSMRVRTAADDRNSFLRRPDLGRVLSAESREDVAAISKPVDLLILIADGLSSTGVEANATSVIEAILPYLRKEEWQLGPILLASQARVALGDDAGETMGARAVVILIGERPGLSSPDSLGAYLTWSPRMGRADAERNCISNIRSGGLSADEAAFKAHWLLKEFFRRQVSGVTVKDKSNYQIERPRGSQLTLGE
jgi:ethanolamine ammonia-lyase small subunit